MIYKSLVFLAVSVCVATARDGLLDLIPARARGGRLWDRVSGQLLGEEAMFTNSTVNHFVQNIEHTAGAGAGTFNQRYYVDESYCNDMEKCPIFLYIGGEGTLSGTPGGHVSTLAKEHNALILALEHRWYGESLPGDITSTKDLLSLTVENAIADLAAFILDQEMKLSGGASRTWLTIGGSYPGALSAWFRLKHPELTSASWSSSGVILAVEEFTRFDEIIGEAVGEDCAASLRGVMAAFEAEWDAGGARRSALRALFNTPEDFTKGDMAWMLADSAAMGPQYGAKEELCSYMVPTPAGGGEGLLSAFADWTKAHYGDQFGASCYYSTSCLSDPSRASEWLDTKSWIWQCCHQLEYWQVAYPNALRSSALTLDYFRDQCTAAFGDYPVANVTAFNAAFQGLTPSSTNVIALNGGDDPWQGCTLNATLRESYPESTAKCDGCGHCGDLSAPSRSDPPELAAQKQMIKEYVAKWIGA